MKTEQLHIIGNSPLLTGIAKFLINDFGRTPGRAYITERVPEEHQESVAQELANFEGGLKFAVTFTGDGGLPAEEIANDVKENPLRQTPYILGSYWDSAWAI